MKLCVDCKHHLHEESDLPAFDCHWCYAHISPVTGLRVRRDCEKERAGLTIKSLSVGEIITGCGPDGNLWEPK